MPELNLSKVLLTDLNGFKSAHALGMVTRYDTLRLKSCTNEITDSPDLSLWFYLQGNEAGRAFLTKEDFLAVYHTLKPEVDDQLNILGLGMKNAPGKDQLQGAGTNNYTQV